MSATDQPAMIENRTFDEIAIGDRAEVVRTLRREDIELFATVSGDLNPAHVDEDYANTDRFHRVIAHGMWSGAVISSLLGTRLPGPGTLYLGQSLKFLRPIGLGDTIRFSVTVATKEPEHRRVTLDCRAENQAGEVVVSGEALVIAPDVKVVRPLPHLPEVILHRDGEHRLMAGGAPDAQAFETYRITPAV